MVGLMLNTMEPLFQNFKTLCNENLISNTKGIRRWSVFEMWIAVELLKLIGEFSKWFNFPDLSSGLDIFNVYTKQTHL